MDLGFISIRNEDGTQWYGTSQQWGPRSGRRAWLGYVFKQLEEQVSGSIKNNSPDNGYFGLMNLTWHPCTDEEAAEATKKADAYDAECAAEDELFDIQLEALNPKLEGE